MGLSAGGTIPERGRRKGLTGESFEALLVTLGPDRDQAGARYEGIRDRLLRFFAWRGAHASEELADETFDRVSRRLAEGETIRSSDVARYFLGVARNVLREAWDRERRQAVVEPLDDRTSQRVVAPPPSYDPREAALACLDRCLEALPPETRDLVLVYYAHQGAEQARQRRDVAARLGIGSNALRIRLHRLRVRLEECVRGCLARRGETPGPGGPPKAEEARG